MSFPKSLLAMATAGQHGSSSLALLELDADSSPIFTRTKNTKATIHTFRHISDSLFQRVMVLWRELEPDKHYVFDTENVERYCFAYEEGHVIGMGILRRGGVVTDLCVTERLRQCGLASNILRVLSKHARTTIKLESEQKNLHIYYKMGFKV